MNTELWDKCKAFHGHECGGLTIGYKAALYAIKLLDLKTDETAHNNSCISSDEQVVCISENDACGVDAIQVIMGMQCGKRKSVVSYERKAGIFLLQQNKRKIRPVGIEAKT